MLLGDARSGKLTDNIVGLGRALRRAGVPVDAQRIASAVQAAEWVGVDRRDDLRAALSAAMVSRQQDLEVFDQLFDALFRNPDLAKQLLSQMLPEAAPAPKSQRKARVQETLTAPRQGAARSKPKEEELRLDAAMSASDAQRLRQADFAGLSASEYRLVEQLAREVPLVFPMVPGRRTRSGTRGHVPHWTAAMKVARKHQGELLWLPMRTRQDHTLPVLILVDISGSMERYSRLLLAFLHRATHGLRRAAFAFGTHLTDLRPAFRQHDTDRMLADSSAAISDFAGGTCLGDSIRSLRDAQVRELVGRRTIVLLISDGLDTGTPESLTQELQWLKRHCRQLLWLNPLLRYDGYAPLATGASVIHRHADAMLAVHNLASLEGLAKALSELMQARRH